MARPPQYIYISSSHLSLALLLLARKRYKMKVYDLVSGKRTYGFLGAKPK